VICVNFAQFHIHKGGVSRFVSAFQATAICLFRNRRVTTLFFYYAYSLHTIHFCSLKNKHLPVIIFIGLQFALISDPLLSYLKP